MLHGRMFISEHFICFFSSLFNEVKLCVPIADVISVCEVNQALIFPNALKLFVRPSPHASVEAAEKAAAKAAKLLGLDKPAAPTTTPTESSYFFGSFGPGGRSKAFALITSLINGTFHPELYYMHEPSRSRADSTSSNLSDDGPPLGTLETNEEEGDEDAEDAATLEDGEDGGGDGEKPSSTKRVSSSLEFGEHRPPANDGSAIEYKDMLEETFPNMNAKTFWKLFMSDSALYTAETYHTTRGDVS
jgi:hypothetical protein